MSSFIPIDMNYFNTPKKNLQNLYYLDQKQGRNDRFFIKNKKIYAHKNYKCPHFDEMSEIYYLALETARNNEAILAKFVAKYTAKSEHTIYYYFRNFKFKEPNFAFVVREILLLFILQNNLFGKEYARKYL